MFKKKKRETIDSYELKAMELLTEIMIELINLEKKKIELKCLEAAKGKGEK